MQHNKNKYSSGITIGAILAIVGIILILTSVGFSSLLKSGSVWSSGQETVDAQSTAVDAVAVSENSMPFSMTMIDVGQGLSLLFRVGDEYALYDGGGRNSSSRLISFLENEGIESFKYVFASHYDEDHIAGLVGVLSSFDVQTCVCPDYIADTAIYSSFIRELARNGCKVEHPAPGMIYDLGDAIFEVLGPLSYEYEIENNKSMVVKAVFGSFSALISADAEEDAELDMVRTGVDLKSQVYVAGHHGSASSSSKLFLAAVAPKHVLISCGEGNDFGHPAASTLKNFRLMGVNLFRSDKQGDVTVMSDGSTLTFSSPPSDDWTPGTYIPN